MVNMAARITEDQRRAVQRFQEALEDLTFNSKPLIDDLTRAAEASKAQAPQIVEIIESRLMQARQDWKLPCLYLLDSIMKNLRGVYLEEISKILVSIFCHCFEKLVDSEPRKALYKLRLTWTPFVPTRKLAAIDRHVHALDPHWPLIAIDASGPSSPTIFVNPKFLEGPSNTTSKPKRPSPVQEGEKNATTGAKKITKKMSKSPSKSPPKVVVTDGKGNHEPPGPLSIQDRRKQILRQVTDKKNAISTSLSAAPEDGATRKLPRIPKKSKEMLAGKRSLSPNPVSNRRAHSKSPKRPRSTSPMEDSPRKKRKKTAKAVGAKSQEVSPPLLKQIKLEKDAESAVYFQPIPPPVKRIKLEKDAKSANIKDSKKDIPLKKSQLQLDDLPPELLPKHQERIKKKMEEHKASGSLSEEQHETIVQQLDKLYELQELKKKNGSEGSDGSPPPSVDSAGEGSRTQSQTQSKDNDSVASKNVPSSSHTMSSSSKNTRSDRFNDLDRPGFRGRGGRERIPRGREMRPGPPRHLLPTPFEPYPPDEWEFPHGPPPPPHNHPPPDYYRGRPPRRGGFRPPRGGPPPGWMERGRGRYFNGPPRGRGRALPGPPPPHWHEPMDMEQNGPPPPHHLELPPSHHGPPPPDMLPPPGPGHGPPPPNHPSTEGDPSNVSALLSKLVNAGLIGGESNSTPSLPDAPGPGPGDGTTGGRVTPPPLLRQTTPPPPPPVSVPRLSLTPATLKQRYTILITLLNSGVPCTSCGLRFKSESAEEYRHHLDWHYQMNRQERDGTGKTSRNWYMHPEDWLKFEELAHDNSEKELTLEPQLPDKDFREKSEQPSEHEQLSCRVLPGDTSDEVCSICQEPLEQFWEENEEEWHFKDAMRNDASKLFHVFCYKDAKESGALDVSGSQLPSPVEVKGTDPFVNT